MVQHAILRFEKHKGNPAKRRELEQQLYEVFRKYADKRQSEEAGA